MNGVVRKLLIVENDLDLQRQYQRSFSAYQLRFATDQDSAMAEARHHEPQVVLLDLGGSPDTEDVSNGFATLSNVVRLAPFTKVIVSTAYADDGNAVRAVALGAYDFVHKPVELDALKHSVERAFRIYELEEESRRQVKQKNGCPLQGIIGTSEQMVQVCRKIEKLATTDTTALLQGESGTGKELLARAVHILSPRAENRFVAINCAAIPEFLLESELFGHEKGAFTGAVKQTLGKIEYAERGTLFLDEIGDLPLSLQGKLLRFLQERIIERIGGREEIAVDVRIVCATHQDLSALIAQGGFREDLYYRVSEVTVNIPPLRERKGDAVLLARSFLDKYGVAYGRPLRGFTRDALRAINQFDWPGNVRELENRIKGAVTMADGPQLTTQDLGLETDSHRPLLLNLREIRSQAERTAVREAINLASGNVSDASKLLGVSRPTLYDLMRKHNLMPQSG